MLRASVGALLQPRRPSVGAQDEWELECSWRRIFCALNETLADAALHAILVGFLTELRRDDLLAEMGKRDLYFVLAETMRLVEDAEDLWADYVRMCHPQAPKNFDVVGRMGNERKNRSPSEPPSRRMNVRGPRRHPDESDSGWGSI